MHRTGWLGRRKTKQDSLHGLGTTQNSAKLRIKAVKGGGFAAVESVERRTGCENRTGDFEAEEEQGRGQFAGGKKWRCIRRLRGGNGGWYGCEETKEEDGWGESGGGWLEWIGGWSRLMVEIAAGEFELQGLEEGVHRRYKVVWFEFAGGSNGRSKWSGFGDYAGEIRVVVCGFEWEEAGFGNLNRENNSNEINWSCRVVKTGRRK